MLFKYMLVVMQDRGAEFHEMQGNDEIKRQFNFTFKDAGTQKAWKKSFEKHIRNRAPCVEPGGDTESDPTNFLLKLHEVTHFVNLHT